MPGISAAILTFLGDVPIGFTSRFLVFDHPVKDPRVPVMIVVAAAEHRSRMRRACGVVKAEIDGGTLVDEGPGEGIIIQAVTSARVNNGIIESPREPADESRPDAVVRINILDYFFPFLSPPLICK